MTNIQSILMVRPSGFKTNIQTLENNFFQNISNLNENELLEKAQQEFDNLVNKIRSNGIPIIVFQDDQKHETPDSLFPNNWISFHKKNTIALYPMFAENRRLERSFELIKFIEKNGVIINNIHDYTEAENNNEFLEGTGSMVLDRTNNKVYASARHRSPEHRRMGPIGNPPNRVPLIIARIAPNRRQSSTERIPRALRIHRSGKLGQGLFEGIRHFGKVGVAAKSTPRIRVKANGYCGHIPI